MSETFQVTARKWRPMRFDEVVGQEHVTRTLKNAIREGRLAHAYLFTGQRGCGKTTVARLLAKAINCPNAEKNGFEPCNKCDVCLSITDGRSMDVAEIDGASNNGVDDVRMLRENVKYPPLQGQYKVIIIDEVHMLSTSAFNALLKTLEEPPRHLVFVFATTEAQKVLPTILSRTQRYDFRRIQLEEIVALLRKISDAEKIKIDDDALIIIAKKADGSARDAESIFDQVIAFAGMKVETAKLREALNLIDLDFYFDVTTAIAARDAKRAFELAADVVSRGYDIEEFFNGLLEHFRGLLTVAITGTTTLLEVSKAHQERYEQSAKDFSESDLLRLTRLGQNAIEKLRTTEQPRIVLEVTLVEMMLIERAVEIAELLNEVRALRNGGIPAKAAPEKKTEVVTEREAAPSISPQKRVAADPAPEKPTAKQEPAPTKPAAKTEPVAAEADGKSLDNDTVARRWREFGEFLKTKSRPLHSILPDLEFCGIRKQTLFISAAGKPEKDMLLTMKDEMTLALREFFGTQLTFETGGKPEMLAKAGNPVVIKPEIVEDVVKPKQERSELELALIEQLGAQEV